MKLTTDHIEMYGQWLREQERSEGTVENYLRHLRSFAEWMKQEAESKVTKEIAVRWKKYLQTQYAPVTVNAILSALNGFFHYAGWNDIRVKFLKIQRKLFREPERELTQAEYEKLVRTANAKGKQRLALVMETICATGIRISELRYITVEAARRGRADVALKGKIRTILLPRLLCRKLLDYVGKRKTASGEIFTTRTGKPLSRFQVWAEMKAVCKLAGIAPGKVFPHNLRHLFANKFYQASKDISHLADVLGHSSIETTRIYLISTGEEHIWAMERLGLLS